MKIRLIDPAYDHPYISHSQKVIKKIWFAHLTLTTLAALTPPEIEVSITDENVEPIDYDEEVDLVGITGMVMHAPKAYEIAQRFRERGIPVVMGGPHASSLPFEAKEHVDAVVVGEAEMVWEGLLEDLKKGCLKPFYKADAFCSMKGSPFPRIDLLRQKAYMTVNCVQTTRGCPHQCDFCHVTHFFGKTYRCRPVEEVIEEVSRIHTAAREFERSFCSRNNIHLSLGEETVDRLVTKVWSDNVDPAEFLERSFENYEHGLRLLKEKTGRAEFSLPPEALDDPEGTLNTLIRDAYHG